MELKNSSTGNSLKLGQWTFQFVGALSARSILAREMSWQQRSGMTSLLAPCLIVDTVLWPRAPPWPGRSPNVTARFGAFGVERYWWLCDREIGHFPGHSPSYRKEAREDNDPVPKLKRGNK